MTEKKETRLGKAGKPPKAATKTPPKAERSIASTLAGKIMKKIDLNKVKGDETTVEETKPVIKPASKPAAAQPAAQTSSIVYAANGKLDVAATAAARATAVVLPAYQEDLRALMLKPTK